MKILLCCTFALLTVGGVTTRATEWPQYRGPNQDGISLEQVSLPWPSGGPKVVWKIPTKNGFSSFAISGGKVFTQVNRDIDGAPREIVVALDAQTGQELWFVDVGSGKYDRGGDSGADDNKGGDGPRATPVVSDGKVYAFTQNLVLSCLDAETGKTLWKKDLIKEYAGRNIGWKNAMSAVVDGDRVFVGGGGAGQSLLAFNKSSGEVIWKSGDETITHATPVAATIRGVRQVIYFLKSGLVSVAAQNGKALWHFPFKFSVSTAASPVVAGDVVYCSAGYGVGGGACKITKSGDQFTATELWKIPGDKQVANHWSTPIFKDDHLYGMFSFKKYGVGPLKCVELATGKVKWEQPGFGAGNVILVGNRLLALTDDGQLVVVEATPAAYKELARTKAVSGKCWSTPAFSNGRVYVRSTREGACLDLTGQ
jgi:outer membrane protein assembly factor BamB